MGTTIKVTDHRRLQQYVTRQRQAQIEKERKKYMEREENRKHKK